MFPLAVPESDTLRVATLQTLRAALFAAPATHPDAPHAYRLGELVPGHLVTDLQATTAALEAAHAALQSAEDRRGRTAAAARTAFVRLGLCVRGIWAAMGRHARDPRLDAATALRYHLPPPRARRMKGPRGEWLPAAGLLLHRLQELDAAGDWVPAEPSPAELTACLEAATAADHATQEALTALKQAQDTMAGMRHEAGSLYRGLAGCVRMSLRKLPAGARRDIMRIFGFRFRAVAATAAAAAPAPAAQTPGSAALKPQTPQADTDPAQTGQDTATVPAHAPRRARAAPARRRRRVRTTRKPPAARGRTPRPRAGTGTGTRARSRGRACGPARRVPGSAARGRCRATDPPGRAPRGRTRPPDPS